MHACGIKFVCVLVVADGGSVYHVPVGVPLMRGQGGDGMNHTIDQSFTQFDIPRPKGSLPYSAASTPAGQRVTSCEYVCIIVSCIMNQKNN